MVLNKGAKGKMQKSVRLALNKFPSVPKSLEDPAKKDTALSEIMVDLGDLYTHYYIQSFDRAPPSPNPAYFEHVRHLEPCVPFRFQPKGLGANKSKKGNMSNELGEAFCRWFLMEHLDIVRVARIEDVRGHGALAYAGNVSVEHDDSVEGNAPDYFCVESNGQVCLAEAKGTTEAVGFGTKKFVEWRKQFDRVKVLGPGGNALSVDGYIIAMRWATDKHGPRVFTTLLAEDPRTPGDQPFRDEEGAFACAINALHYVQTMGKIRLPILAAALRTGTVIAPELRARVAVWESVLPQLKGMRFVGGYYPGDTAGMPPYSMWAENYAFGPLDPFRLDLSSGTFFGLEEKIFSRLVDAARQGPTAVRNLPSLERQPTGDDSVSLLQDGHVLGPVDFFFPVDVRPV